LRSHRRSKTRGARECSFPFFFLSSFVSSFFALIKIDAGRFILPNEAAWTDKWRDGPRDTGYGTDHACEGCFHPPDGGRGSRGRGRYTFGTPALYIAEKPDLPGNKNFFLHPSRVLPPSSLPLISAPPVPSSTCNPLLIPPSSPSATRSAVSPSPCASPVKQAPSSNFLSAASPYLALSRGDVDSESN